MPPALQRLAVADSGRAAPHLRVHGWCPEDPLRAGEDRGREQIIPEPDGGPRHRVCGRRGYEDEIGPAGERDVFDAARTLPPGHVRVDAGADCDGESLFWNKAEGSFCGDGPDLVPGLSEAPDHTRRLVRRNAARYPDEYSGHLGSIQSRHRRGPGSGHALAECRPQAGQYAACGSLSAFQLFGVGSPPMLDREWFASINSLSRVPSPAVC